MDYRNLRRTAKSSVKTCCGAVCFRMRSVSVALWILQC